MGKQRLERGDRPAERKRQPPERKSQKGDMNREREIARAAGRAKRQRAPLLDRERVHREHEATMVRQRDNNALVGLTEIDT